MAHRPEDTETLEASQPKTGTVWLSDVEPVLGLLAALGRFNSALTSEAMAAMSPAAIEALSTIQGTMWRLEHSHVDVPPTGGDG